MFHIYFDNDVVSSVGRGDRGESAMAALSQLLNWKQAGTIELDTSRQSVREMEQAPERYRDDLKVGLRGLGFARDDHKVLGSHALSDPYGGCICSPLVSDVVDEVLYAKLLEKMLEPGDAKHFMYAVHNGYDYFVTWDRDFLSRRALLELLCKSIRILTPEEVVSELEAITEVRPGSR